MVRKKSIGANRVNHQMNYKTKFHLYNDNVLIVYMFYAKNILINFHSKVYVSVL